jgi:hypothetical protein
MVPIAIDRGDQLRQGYTSLAGDFLQAVPELIFKADAGLVPAITIERFETRDFTVSPPRMTTRLYHGVSATGL